MQSDLQFIYEHYLQSGSVTTDTRDIVPGSIFFALKGPRFDGNRFVAQALEQGSSLAVVDDKTLKGKSGCLWVPDVLQALQSLARYHRKMLQIPVIGITGTNGKTTTKELVTAVLSKKYKVWSTKGNLNNHIGVPLTLLSIPPGTEVAVVEMGANHPGEIRDLCQIAFPNHGLITNVGMAHLEGFGSFEGVKKTKGELYRFLMEAGGEIFINTGDSNLLGMVGDYPYIGYGEGKDAVVSASSAQASPLLSFQLTTSRVVDLKIDTRLTGLYNLDNFLAAASIGHYFGVDETLVKQAFEGYVPQNNRSQFTQTQRNQVLVDAYNANPSSMKVALENFSAIDHPHKYLILGGMKELGNSNMNEHQSLMAGLMKMTFEGCFLVGEEFENLIPVDARFCWFPNTAELKKSLLKNEISGAMVLIKGSRANQLEQVMDCL